jgi:hypothetical protein
MFNAVLGAAVLENLIVAELTKTFHDFLFI